MIEAREWRGEWWDARDRDSRVAGVLNFSPSKIEIELIGRLPSFSDEPATPFDLTERRRICGVTTDGNAITLERCIPTHSSFGSGVPVERHHADMVLVGAYYSESEPLIVEEAHFHFTHLAEWAGVSGFSYSLDFADEKSVEQLAVSYKPPDPVEVTLADGTNLAIRFQWSWSGVSATTVETTITQTAMFTATFTEPVSLAKVLELGGKLRNFLHLGVGAPVHPTAITAAVPADVAEGEESKSLQIEVLYQPSDPATSEELTERRDAHRMTFTLPDILETYEQKLSNWLSKYDELKPTFDLYFAVGYGAMRYSEPRFLALAQALEAYHRRTNPTVPGKKGPVFRKRLGELLDRHGHVSERLIADRGTFLDVVVNGRNYFTHYDEKLAATAPTGIAVVSITAQLSALAEACLLSELGFTTSEIDALFEKSRRYELVRHLEQAIAERAELD